jgi:light-regulated signal transduction histidine kinase (bacteriophytochrome)/CheY-like chemotaxis protein
MMTSPEGVTLTNCDREPIHIPGSIQPHGCLLAFDAELRSVERHSANAAVLLGREADSLMGASLDTLVGPRCAHDIRNVLTTSTNAARPGLMMGAAVPDGSAFDIAVHRYKGNAIVELEPARRDRAGRPLELARALIGRLKDLSSVDMMMMQTPRLLRVLLDYDRVMIYQFAHDGAGCVRGEAKRDDLESFLGQYFPASDIPRQARELYLKNTIRIISDASCERIPILPDLDASGEPLDLSYAHLRSVSPIHCEYLRNMGVAASMSISIIVGGELWGLIACHHYSPRSLSMAERVAAEMFGDFFSLHLEALHQKNRLEAAVAARRVLDGLLREVSYHSDIESFLRERIATFANLIPSDGVGLWINGAYTAHGTTPPAAAIPALARLVASVSEGKVWGTHELSSLLPAAEAYRADVSGVLAVPLSQVPRDYLLFFRKEVVETVSWAGNPDKEYQTGPSGDRLTPRKSFAIWKQTVERQSLPWMASDRESAEAVRTALLEVIMRQTELLSAERRKADVRQKVLNEELNHRVKNILALIKSLVSRPVEDARSLDEYVVSLKGRIMALAFAHDQVIRSDGGGNLRDLLEAELGPYGGGKARITIEGPSVGLDARAYSVMALVFHELATNAAKYGALAVDGGHLDVRWSLTETADCEVRWRETGKAGMSTPARRGFGMVLIDRSVPFDLGGESELVFEPGGVSARFLIPSKFVSAVSVERGKTGAVRAGAGEQSATLEGLRVLIVEDQLVIAMDVETVLSRYGTQYIDTAATSAEALRIVTRTAPDVAILDINLGIGTSLPVAEELTRRKIPFVFATGYGDSLIIPRSMASVPIVRKPHDEGLLVEAINVALSRARAGTSHG